MDKSCIYPLESSNEKRNKWNIANFQGFSISEIATRNATNHKVCQIRCIKR